MSDLTWKDAIIAVLRDAGTAMHYTDIAEEIFARGYKARVGATPARSVVATIASSRHRDGRESPFVQLGAGDWALKESVQKAANDPVEPTDMDDDEVTSVGIIQAFGMYWMREKVYWSNSCALFGQQQIGADVVDFAQQRGVYMLHDQREVIYVGRATDRPLGRRLYEHTRDRHRSRWDCFSWFGLRIVSEEGTLGEVIHDASESMLITTIEAVLIEGLEPRQNRRRGDDFSAVEYHQTEDPAIEKQQMQMLLAEMQQKLSGQ